MTKWPLFGQADEAVTPFCPHCGQPVPAYASYCEACGGTLTPTQPMPPDVDADTASSSQTRRLGVRVSDVSVCPQCGGRIDADGYCQQCGARAPRPHDHVEQSPVPWVAGVSDIGRSHSRNEDALAVWAGDGQAVLVVCDGVTTSQDSDVAAVAGADQARGSLVAFVSGLTAGGSDATPFGASSADAFREAVVQANAAVIDSTAPDSANAASATFAAAVIDGDSLGYANLGDSRVYWIGEREATLLSTDDSMAQEFIKQGMTRDAAEAMPQAHAITKWLGRDAVDIVPDSGVMAMTEPGWVLVCSDGLWNYASEPTALAAVVRELASRDAEPLAVARGLVAWANERGGHDNISVALAHHGESQASL